MQTNVLYPTHHSTGIWIFSLCVEWAAPERWLFCKKEQAIRHSTHHKQGGAAANSKENRSVPPVWVCLRLLQSKQKAPSIRVGTFRSMHGVWSLCARRRNPASPLIEMRFAHGCRQQVLFVWRMQNPLFFARQGVFAGEIFAGFPPLFYKSRRRRAICSANRKCSKKKHHPSGWCFFLPCVDRKDAFRKMHYCSVCWVKYSTADDLT